MKREIPVKKNDDLLLEVTALTGEGQGVGRAEGFAVFAVGALPEETVEAHVIKVADSYAIAKTTNVVTASPHRVKPACPAFPQCGGCTLQHLSYPAQLIAKRQQVADALTRLGGVKNPRVLETIGMEAPWHYRNKGSFPFGLSCGAPAFGFYAGRSHRLVPLSDCPIQDSRIVEIARKTTAWAEENGIAPYDEEMGKGALRHVMARVSAGGESMAVIVTKGPLKKREQLLDALEGVDSLWHNQNDGDTNVILGKDFTLLAGKKTITEVISGKEFLVSPQSFLQVNAAQTGVLYETAVNLLRPTKEEAVVDAYCGIGTISLLLADRCGKVTGVEQVPEAIADAVNNAKHNGVTNAEFLCGNVEEVLPKLVQGGAPIHAVMLDPPRKGCEESALAAMADSGANRIVYVSCNPATLARDVKYLATRGYQLETAQPVDMFPHTSHVETVALLTKGACGETSRPAR